MFGGRYLRQRTALGSESTALQTETTLGLPTGEKERICGKNVINLLIFWVFPHLFGQFAGRSVADPRYFFVFFFTFFVHFSQDSADFVFWVFPHFLVDWQADVWRTLGISFVFFFAHFFLGQNQRLCGPFLCCCWFSHTFWQCLIGLFRLKIQCMQNAPPGREEKKKGGKKNKPANQG